MDLILWTNFNKKSNSTKRPTIEEGTLVDVKLKSNTSMENPVFLIDGVNLATNYCYLNSVGRYYFITDIIIGNNNIYELHCSCDYLATFKNEIGNYTAFVERATSNISEYLIDGAVSSTQNVRERKESLTSIPGITGGSGCYILRVVGGSGNGISTFVAANLDTFLPIFNKDLYVFDGIFEEELSDALQKLGLLMFDPFSYILSLSWCPFTYQYMSNFGSNVNVFIKWFDTGISALKLNSQFSDIRGSVAVPSNVYSDFRAYTKNFSDYQIYLPGVGSFDLSAQDAHETIYYAYEVDLFTGSCFVRLYSGPGQGVYGEIGTYSGSLYTQIPIGSDAMNIGSVVGGVVNSIGGFASGNIPLGVGGAVESITNVIAGTPRSNGTSGNGTALRQLYEIVVTLTNYDTGEAPATVLGKPVMKNIQLNTMSGFIKCGNASIDIGGYITDKDSVNTLLNSGFYYE